MIQIKFIIQDQLSTQNRKLQICNHNQRNLEELYYITKEITQKLGKISFDQFMVISGFHIVQNIRMRQPSEAIKKNLVKEWSKNKNIIKVFKQIKNITIEAMVDNIPKKVLSFSIKRDLMPVISEPRV